MTIHHDKMAYGKLDPLREEFSLERLNDMADALNGEDEGRSEREKMLAGELYDPSDPELSALRARARRLARAYNDAGEDEPERRRELLRELFGGCGENITCEPPLRLDYGCNTTVGEHFFANFNLVILRAHNLLCHFRKRHQITNRSTTLRKGRRRTPIADVLSAFIVVCNSKIHHTDVGAFPHLFWLKNTRHRCHYLFKADFE